MSYSICRGKDCPIKDSCLRFLSTETDKRTFFKHEPHIIDFDDQFKVRHRCDYYDEIRLVKKDITNHIDNLTKLFQVS